MLDAFVDTRDNMTDADIAEASGASVADVRAWRAKLDAPPATDAPPPKKDPAPKKKDDAAEKKGKAPDPETPAPPDAPAAPEAESAPASVRVTASRVPGVRFEGMKNPIELRFGGVYSGANAAHLWANFRHAVERYPKG